MEEQEHDEGSNTTDLVRPSDKLQSDIDQCLRIEIQDLNSQSILNLIRLTKQIADGLRDLRLRNSVGQTELIPHILNILRHLIDTSSSTPSSSTSYLHGTIEAYEQMMRVLGNLVHTHDINRAKCLSHGAHSIFRDLLNTPDFNSVTLLSSSPSSHCLQIILTVLFNLCFEYVPAHDAYIEVGLIEPLSRLIQLIGEIDSEIPLLAIRLLEEVCSSDDAKRNIPPHIVQALLSPITFVQLLDPQSPSMSDQTDRSNTLETLTIACSLLESLSETSEPIQKLIRSSQSPSTTTTTPTLDPELSTTVLGRLLCFIRYLDLPQDYFDSDDQTLTNPLNKSKAHLSRTLVNVIGVGETEDGLESLLIRWFSDLELVNSRPDLVTTLGLLLGNLACSDSSSSRLIQRHEILEPLRSGFQIWGPQQDLPSSSVRPGERAQVLHSLCGLARNLAVAEKNQEKIGQSGLIELISECLIPEFDIVQPLLALALGFLRHVCKRNVPNVIRLTTGSDVYVSRVIDVMRRVDQPHIRLEAARLLSSAISTVSLSRVGPNPSIPVSPSSEDTSRAIEVLGQIGVVEGMIELLCVGVGSNVILINEALVALALLASRPTSAHGLVKTLTQIRDPRSYGEGEPGPKRAIELLLGCWLGWKRTESYLDDSLWPSGYQPKVILVDPVQRNASVVLMTLAGTLKVSRCDGLDEIRNVLIGLSGRGDDEFNQEEKDVIEVWNKL